MQVIKGDTRSLDIGRGRQDLPLSVENTLKAVAICCW